MANQINDLIKIYKKLAAQETPYDVMNGSRSWCQADYTPGMDKLANQIGEAEAELRAMKNAEYHTLDHDGYCPCCDDYFCEKGKMEEPEPMYEERINKMSEIDLDPDVDNMPKMIGVRLANLQGYDLSVEVLQNRTGVHFWLVNDGLPDADIRRLHIKTINDPDEIKAYLEGLKQMFPNILIVFKVETQEYKRVGFNDFIDVIYS